MKPKVPPSIFTKEGKPTPRSDEMLLIYSKDSPELKNLIEEIISLKYSTKWDGTEGKYIKYTPCNLFVFFQDNRIFTFGKHAGCESHNLSLESVEQIIKKLDSNNGVIKQYCVYELLEWSPEEVVKNGYSYIGNIDLFLRIKIIKKNQMIDKLNQMIILEFDSEHYLNIIIEFKPEIKSFTEVIRQIKVYEQFKNSPDRENITNCSVVITYSDISKFKDIFTNSNILLKQIQEIKK